MCGKLFRGMGAEEQAQYTEHLVPLPSFLSCTTKHEAARPGARCACAARCREMNPALLCVWRRHFAACGIPSSRAAALE